MFRQDGPALGLALEPTDLIATDILYGVAQVLPRYASRQGAWAEATLLVGTIDVATEMVILNPKKEVLYSYSFSTAYGSCYNNIRTHSNLTRRSY